MDFVKEAYSSTLDFKKNSALVLTQKYCLNLLEFEIQLFGILGISMHNVCCNNCYCSAIKS